MRARASAVVDAGLRVSCSDGNDVACATMRVEIAVVLTFKDWLSVRKPVLKFRSVASAATGEAGGPAAGCAAGANCDAFTGTSLKSRTAGLSSAAALAPTCSGSGQVTTPA